MPRWWRRKRGREGRALRGTRGSRFHLAVAAGGEPLAIQLGPGNENERRYLLPLLDELERAGIRPRELWADRGYASRGARAGARPAPDPLLRQPAAHAGRSDPGRPAHARGLARQETAPEDTRSAGSPPLARRAHQRLAESAAPDRHPPRPQTRELPRLSRARHDRHPHPIILRHAPDPGPFPLDAPTRVRDAWPQPARFPRGPAPARGRPP